MTEQTKRVAREPTAEMVAAVEAPYPLSFAAIWRVMFDAAPDADAGRVGEFHCPHAVPNCSVCRSNMRVRMLLAAEDVLIAERKRIAELERRIERALASLIPNADGVTSVYEARAILRGDQP